ncbi:MAG TPA: hypothetical protein VKG85_09090, partial [Actinomycetes bacterium]|nr:hypothetical protein [Actinomycetes bacterium]
MLEPHRRSRTAAAFRIISAAGLIAAGLAGCGGSDGSGPRSDAPDGQQAPSVAATAGVGSGQPGSAEAVAQPGLRLPPPAGVWPDVSLARPELPRGGRTLFPRYRLVGYAGHPTSDGMGRLGIGDIDQRARELERRARSYAAGRTAQPVFELIAVVATSFPGPAGLYRSRAEPAVVDEFLAAARRHRALLLLNVQPGRADFLPEVKAFERWLREPDVGLALDPEWAVGPGQVPGEVYGWTSGAELDRVARYLAGIVKRYDLPEKPLVFHQVAASVVQDQQDLRRHRGVVVIKSVDGIGPRHPKETTWRRLVSDLPPAIHTGFKLFFVEDTASGPLMTPAQVLAL